MSSLLRRTGGQSHAGVGSRLASWRQCSSWPQRVRRSMGQTGPQCPQSACASRGRTAADVR
eukprot:9853048-Heterocapsa_arctica.AAC.1